MKIYITISLCNELLIYGKILFIFPTQTNSCREHLLKKKLS